MRNRAGAANAVFVAVADGYSELDSVYIDDVVEVPRVAREGIDAMRFDPVGDPQL
jgi:hypothetical protein